MDLLHVVMASLVGTFLLTSWVSGMYARRGFGKVRCRVMLTYSPSKTAFSIWSVIYLLTVTNVAVQIVGEIKNLDMYSTDVVNALHATAWGLAAVWLPLFGYADTAPWLYIMCGLVLLAMAATSFAASVLCASEWAEGGSELRRWTLAAPLSFLAGWTCVAASLNVGIAFMANAYPGKCALKRNTRSYWLFSQSKEGIETMPTLPSVVPLVLATGLVTVALFRPDPILPIPLIWAILFMRYTHLHVGAFLVCLVGVVAAFVRVYA